MPPIASAAVLGLLACLCLVQGADADDAAPFDQPLQTRRVVLGPSPNSPGQQSVVRCYTYRGLMVKEIDTDEVGDDQISVIPLASPTVRPPCQEANRQDERIVPNGTWGGYFLGVKADYVFLSGADGTNGGMGFAIFRGSDTTRLLFQDLAKLDHDRIQFRTVSVDGDDLLLRYTRLHVAPCSVQTDGAPCWARVVADIRLPSTPSPDCAAGYLRAKREAAAGRCEAQSHRGDAACLRKEMQGLADWDASPSVIGYGVEVVLRPSGPRTIATGAANSCWPTD